MTIYNQLLQQTYGPQLDDKARNLLEQTVEAGQRMDNLLRDLLDYTQAANTPQEVKPARMRIARSDKALAALKVSIDVRTPLLSSAGLCLSFASTKSISSSCSATASNAIKYRGTADPQIRVAAERMGTTWGFSSPTTDWIDPKYHQQIFGIASTNRLTKT